MAALFVHSLPFREFSSSKQCRRSPLHTPIVKENGSQTAKGSSRGRGPRLRLVVNIWSFKAFICSHTMQTTTSCVRNPIGCWEKSACGQDPPTGVDFRLCHRQEVPILGIMSSYREELHKRGLSAAARRGLQVVFHCNETAKDQNAFSCGFELHQGVSDCYFRDGKKNTIVLQPPYCGHLCA